MAVKDGALRFVVFLGSVRDGNFGQRAAAFIVKKLQDRGHQTTLLGELSACTWSTCTRTRVH